MLRTTPRRSLKPEPLLEVEAIEGEPGCFWVQSRSRLNLRHRVDMLFYGGNGACGCEDFERRFRKHLEAGAEPSRRLACWHIRQVRDHSAAVIFWPQVYRAMADRDANTKLENRTDERKRHADFDDFEDR